VPLVCFLGAQDAVTRAIVITAVNLNVFSGLRKTERRSDTVAFYVSEVQVITVCHSGLALRFEEATLNEFLRKSAFGPS
jgi:hypothetical protein